MSNLCVKKGYAIYPQVVPIDMCERVVDDILKHCTGDDAPLTYGGLVEMYHYQSMWDIRQYPPIHEIFTELFKTQKLWVSIDRVCYKPPQGKTTEGSMSDPAGFMHWDINPNQKPRPVVFQGLVALRDTTEDMGGFHCLPSLYKNLSGWLQTLPNKKCTQTSLSLAGGFAYPCALSPDSYKYVQNIPRWKVEKVPMKAGGLLVWDSFLPHGNGRNEGTEPRFCQYITMEPAGDHRASAERWYCHQNKLPPSGLAFPGDPREIEMLTPPAVLTELGRKLLGIDSW